MKKPPHNYKLTISYKGTHFFGWQKSSDGLSVEEALETGLQTLLKHPVSLQAASRTDRGVHAEGQVVNFFSSLTIDTPRFLYSLNALTPKDIAILSLETAPASFHPTLEACGKEYHYLLANTCALDPFLRDVAWHYPKPLSLQLMKAAAAQLIGDNDFSSFTNAGEPKSALCNLMSLNIEPQQNGTFLFALKGNRFLYKMARNLVGTLVYVGCRKLSLETLPHILKSKDRTLSGMTAPAQGLTLKKVFYNSTRLCTFF